MSTLADNAADRPEHEPDPTAEAMNDKLLGDVSSWKAAKSEAAMRPSTELSVPAAKAPAARPPARAKSSKPAANSAPDAAGKKRPFGMSYDGMSQADYITYMISRGAR